MNMKTTLGAALAATAMLASPAMAKTFDITTGFGASPFTYGTIANGAFSAFSTSDCSAIGIPSTCYRGTDTYQVIAQHSATQLLVHPGPNDAQYSAIGFVAPRSGQTYTFNLNVLRGDSGDGVGVSLFANGFVYSLANVSAAMSSYNFSVSFLGFGKGSVLGIAIDRGGAASNYYNDSTFVSGTVTGAVPEPATWAMMILGMGAVGFAMRRRKAVRTTVRYA